VIRSIGTVVSSSRETISSISSAPRIVNQTRSARSAPARPGDAAVPSAGWPGLQLRAYPQSRAEDRVHPHDEIEQLFSLPARWTDVAAVNPFVVAAARRRLFTRVGLAALADRLRAQRGGTPGRKPDYAVIAKVTTPRLLNSLGVGGDTIAILTSSSIRRISTRRRNSVSRQVSGNHPDSRDDQEPEWPCRMLDQTPGSRRWPTCCRSPHS
jgi:hypothetical protein